MTEHEGAGHYLVPHDHAWQVRQWGQVVRCSGRRLCTKCWTWVEVERCHMAAEAAAREARRAERAATATAATAAPAERTAVVDGTAFRHDGNRWQIEPVGVGAR